ncbi:hypothetical protein MXB_751 [Myxobolus squamalis]|nr:hypothetical protein MXB_751 [Myxobolus squamalis]
MSLLSQHSSRLWRSSEFRNKWSAGVYESMKTPYTACSN